MPPKYFGSNIASVNKNFDIQRTYHFVLELTGIRDFAGGSIDEFSFAVQSVKIPDLTNNAIELAHGATTVKYSGQQEFSDVDITVVDYVGFDMELWLSTWYDKVCMMSPAAGNTTNPDNADYSTVGKGNYNADYKRNAKLIQLAPDGSVIDKRSWNLMGIFPTSYQPGSFDYTSNDKKQITMTFSVDYAYRQG